MNDLLKNVPEAFKENARKEMIDYGAGNYNRSWHFARAKAVDTWNKKYGGNIHVQCVEFGCLDATFTKKSYNGVGVSDADRISFIRDLRESFEAYNISFSYWSYNEIFTVLKPTVRIPFESPFVGYDEQKVFDFDLLDALGVTPTIKRP